MDEQPPRQHALRRGRVSIPGQAYLVTTVTSGREPLFAEFSRARMLITLLRDQEQMRRARTLAFVVMPDHLHWLMLLGADTGLAQAVGRLKSYSAHRIGRRVWQKGFHDHAIRDEDDLLEIARYIVANPLRAGLVDEIGQYPHWDAVWL
ncbi:MAG TPA: transposase [Gammaproteobacteria bacterium]